MDNVYKVILVLVVGVFLLVGLTKVLEYGDPQRAQAQLEDILGCDENPASVKSVTPISIPIDNQSVNAVYLRIDVCGADDTDWIVSIYNGQLVIAGG